jgi:SMI1 / KNR4 family (SUKH-1)
MTRIGSMWDRESSATYPPVTQELIERVKKRLGRKLPASMIALFQAQNGGYLKRRFHPKVNGEIDRVPGISPTLSEGFGSHDWSDVIRYMTREGVTEPTGLEAMVPFAGDGHYFVCLDYGGWNGVEPTVSFVDLESFEPSTHVADSFDDYLEELCDEL